MLFPDKPDSFNITRMNARTTYLKYEKLRSRPGSARQDKGFSHVVDPLAYLHKQGIKVPVVMQISGEHYRKYDAATLADIQRLKAIAYPQLQLRPETLNPDQYARLFAGAICLQLYNPSDFSDRVSGVTLDAFSAGSPVVADRRNLDLPVWRSVLTPGWRWMTLHPPTYGRRFKTCWLITHATTGTPVPLAVPCRKKTVRKSCIRY